MYLYVDNYWQPLTSAPPRVRHPESPLSLLPPFVSSASPRFHKIALENVSQKCDIYSIWCPEMLFVTFWQKGGWYWGKYRQVGELLSKRNLKHCKSAKLPWHHNVLRSFGLCILVFFVFLSFCLFIFLSFCLFVFLSFCLFVLLSFCLFAF